MLHASTDLFVYSVSPHLGPFWAILDVSVAASRRSCESRSKKTKKKGNARISTPEVSSGKVEHGIST